MENSPTNPTRTEMEREAWIKRNQARQAERHQLYQLRLAILTRGTREEKISFLAGNEISLQIEQRLAELNENDRLEAEIAEQAGYKTVDSGGGADRVGFG
jgi:hypothetical protein